jgi:hypothetical protein
MTEKKRGGMTVVPEFLRAAAGIYEERNVLYGDNYKRIGPIFELLFPNGVELKKADDFNRFAVFVQILGKVTRYAENFPHGGHEDSLDDNAVYSMMLKELDREAKDHAQMAEMVERFDNHGKGVKYPDRELNSEYQRAVSKLVGETVLK